MTLREKIIQIQCDSKNIQLLNNDVIDAYKIGHRDGKFAASELAINYDELIQVTLAMRDYIDALPSDVVGKLPAMPGFDRDWADDVINGCGNE